MTAQWFLAKYVPDLERNEPINIGLIFFWRERAVTRFIGQRSDGTIDGRSARFVRSAVTYRAWVNHWLHLVEARDVDQLLALARAGDTGENYRLEVGGEILIGGPTTDLDADDLVDDLYVRLVDDTPDRTRESIVQLADLVIGQVQQRAGIAIERENIVTVRADGILDELRFDYRYNNGRPHLMQRVPLMYPDQRSWERVHSVAWQFSQVHRSDSQELQGADLIALVRPREDGGVALERQLRQLEEHANVIDLRVPEAAQDQLADLIRD